MVFSIYYSEIVDFWTNYYYNLSMKTIEEIVTENIIKLRKQNNLKQSDVAEKVNYTNKAVSRWG